jgi:hypothetical protein
MEDAGVVTIVMRRHRTEIDGKTFDPEIAGLDDVPVRVGEVMMSMRRSSSRAVSASRLACQSDDLIG